MTPCLFLISPSPVPPALRACTVGAWSGEALDSQADVRDELLNAWHQHPEADRVWLIDAPLAEIPARLDWLTQLGLGDAPALWWQGHPRALAEGEPMPDLELAAWQAGLLGVLRDDHIDGPGLGHGHGREIERALALNRARHGLPARARFLARELQALRASLDNIPAPIFVKDAAGVYTECNLAFQDYIGLPRQDVVGHTVYDVAPPELAKVYDAADRKLLAAGGRQIYETQVQWADGSRRDVLFHKAVFHDERGRVAGQAGAIFDITDRRAMEKRLRSLAETDALTGLMNRRSFGDQLSARFDSADPDDHDVTVLMLDIDHFKHINDAHGHAAGDAMLRHVAQVIGGHLRHDDVFARLGGDEFAIVLGSRVEAEALAHRLPVLMATTPLDWQGTVLPCRISLGAAVVSAREHTVDSALNLADRVLYEAKEQGRNRAVVVDTRRHPASDPASEGHGR